MNLLAAYIAAWARHDIPAVLATLTNDCVVTESYGPVYHGRGGVEEWMRAWFEEGGSVQSWVINRDLSTDDVLVAEWTFRCIWRNELATFDGATIAISKGPQIQELREYATTGTLYDWKGAWLGGKPTVNRDAARG